MYLAKDKHKTSIDVTMACHHTISRNLQKIIVCIVSLELKKIDNIHKPCSLGRPCQSRCKRAPRTCRTHGMNLDPPAGQYAPWLTVYPVENVHNFDDVIFDSMSAGRG